MKSMAAVGQLTKAFAQPQRQLFRTAWRNRIAPPSTAQSNKVQFGSLRTPNKRPKKAVQIVSKNPAGSRLKWNSRIRCPQLNKQTGYRPGRNAAGRTIPKAWEGSAKLEIDADEPQSG